MCTRCVPKHTQRVSHGLVLVSYSVRFSLIKMSFGEKILQKFGWKEGEGLGKNENGIKKAIKANFKVCNDMDCCGIERIKFHYDVYL